jgi:CheY-like chemotaxis protein
LEKIKAMHDSETGASEPGTGAPATGEDAGKRQPLRILLAEDNPTNKKLVLFMLKRLGYSADVADNGLEAVQALQGQRYDVVLMDVQMPEMDGVEATRRIRQDLPTDAQPRIIALTASDTEDDRELCQEAGMDDYLSKPLQLETLGAALDRYQSQPDVRGGAVLTGTQPAPSAPPSAPEPTKPIDYQLPPALDAAVLQRLCKTLGRRAAKAMPILMDSFHESAHRLLADAHRALEQGQAAELSRAAHTLKSTSASMGAMALSTVARELEFLTKDGTLDGAAELLAHAEAAYAQASAEMEALGEGWADRS